MAIHRLQKQHKKTKAPSKKAKEDAIEAFIQKGGKTVQEPSQEDEIRMTLRLPAKIVERLDVVRKRSPGFLSRNSLILQLVQEGLDQT